MTQTIPESITNGEAFGTGTIPESLKNGEVFQITTRTIPESGKNGDFDDYDHANNCGQRF